MRFPITGWWCGYWEEVKINRGDIIDGGTDCPLHTRNDGGTANRGCTKVILSLKGADGQTGCHKSNGVLMRCGYESDGGPARCGWCAAETGDTDV